MSAKKRFHSSELRKALKCLEFMAFYGILGPEDHVTPLLFSVLRRFFACR